MPDAFTVSGGACGPRRSVSMARSARSAPTAARTTRQPSMPNAAPRPTSRYRSPHRACARAVELAALPRAPVGHQLSRDLRVDSRVAVVLRQGSPLFEAHRRVVAGRDGPVLLQVHQGERRTEGSHAAVEELRLARRVVPVHEQRAELRLPGIAPLRVGVHDAEAAGRVEADERCVPRLLVQEQQVERRPAVVEVPIASGREVEQAHQLGGPGERERGLGRDAGPGVAPAGTLLRAGEEQLRVVPRVPREHPFDEEVGDALRCFEVARVTR